MPVTDKLVNIIRQIRGFSLYHAYCKYPKTYLGMVTTAALLGYGYFLLFPFGVFYGAWQLYNLFPASLNIATVLSTLIWASVILFCAGMSHGIFTIRVKDPEGIALPPAKAPLIFRKLQDIQADIKWPAIDNVVLTRRFELNIIKTPLWGMPFWSRTTLVIGFPFLQSLSPEQFDCALTRKVLQYSKRRNVFINWLSFLRVTWAMYPDAFKQRRKVGDQVSRWILHFYSRFYRYLALYATQLDELHGDAMALNALNDRDLFKTVETIRLVQIFLNQHYWPKLNELMQRNAVAPENIRPYEHLSKSVIQMLHNPRVEHWLKMLSLEKDSQGQHEPAFARRMEYMGYNKVLPVKPFNKTAAGYYLGSGNNRLVQHMNKLWAANLHRDRTRSNARALQRRRRGSLTNGSGEPLNVAF